LTSYLIGHKKASLQKRMDARRTRLAGKLLYVRKSLFSHAMIGKHLLVRQEKSRIVQPRSWIPHGIAGSATWDHRTSRNKAGNEQYKRQSTIRPVLNPCDSVHWRKTQICMVSRWRHQQARAQHMPSHTISPQKPTKRATILPRLVMNSCKCSTKRDFIVFLKWLSAVFLCRIRSVISSRAV
jgi:hypothetical protein